MIKQLYVAFNNSDENQQVITLLQSLSLSHVEIIQVTERTDLLKKFKQKEDIYMLFTDSDFLNMQFFRDETNPEHIFVIDKINSNNLLPNMTKFLSFGELFKYLKNNLLQLFSKEVDTKEEDSITTFQHSNESTNNEKDSFLTQDVYTPNSFTEGDRNLFEEEEPFMEGSIIIDGEPPFYAEEEIENQGNPEYIGDLIENNFVLDDVDKERSIKPSKVVVKNEDGLMERAATIRKQLFMSNQFPQSKIIGVWSPLHRIGVTQFVFNYAIHLARTKLSISVLEIMNNQQNVKELLTRFTDIPADWISLATALTDEKGNIEKVHWNYQNVRWFPLDDNDNELDWSSHLIHFYIKSTRAYDITLVDIPTGKMEAYTLKAIKDLDELWIVVDDHYFDFLGWKNYIHNLKQFEIPIYLIFNKKESFSKVQKLAEELELEMIAEIPALHHELGENNYQRKPIILFPHTYDKLIESYQKLDKHLVNHTGNDVRMAQQPIQMNSFKSKIRAVIDIFK